ncbi:MAG: hypothetical protein JXN64_11545 [Spirochaetes bacterium]|nr:hypothetical protein [Spirochaetota bacterium]
MLKCFTVIIILFSTVIAPEAYKYPDPPKDPSVNFSFKDSGNTAFPVEIICSGKKIINGNLYLRITNISFSHQSKNIQINIKDVKSIEFLEWREKADKKNTFIFYPSKILLIAKNDQQYILDRLPEFNKLDFSENGNKMTLYTYFYDYWEKGKWHNSNTKDINYPRKHPLPGTMLKIIFKENSDLINKTIQSITR